MFVMNSIVSSHLSRLMAAITPQQIPQAFARKHRWTVPQDVDGNWPVAHVSKSDESASGLHAAWVLN